MVTVSSNLLISPVSNGGKSGVGGGISAEGTLAVAANLPSGGESLAITEFWRERKIEESPAQEKAPVN